MKRGSTLAHWTWGGDPKGPPILHLKAGRKPLGLFVAYYVQSRRFYLPRNLRRAEISADRIDESAVAEALAVSLTYEDTS